MKKYLRCYIIPNDKNLDIPITVFGPKLYASAAVKMLDILVLYHDKLKCKNIQDLQNYNDYVEVIKPCSEKNLKNIIEQLDNIARQTGSIISLIKNTRSSGRCFKISAPTEYLDHAVKVINSAMNYVENKREKLSFSKLMEFVEEHYSSEKPEKSSFYQIVKVQVELTGYQIWQMKKTFDTHKKWSRANIVIDNDKSLVSIIGPILYVNDTFKVIDRLRKNMHELIFDEKDVSKLYASVVKYIFY